MTQRDAERSAVYAVEDQWGQVLDRGGELDFFGSRIHVPRQQVFPDLAGIQTYVDELLAQLSVGVASMDAIEPVQVRHRRGVTRAHYERQPTPTIAIPIGVHWAGREVVILHELAHHLRAGGACGVMLHDAQFRGWLIALAELALGAEAALILSVGYQGAGLSIVPAVPAAMGGSGND